MKKYTKICLLIITVFSTTALAEYDHHTTNNITLTMRVYDRLLSYPAPSWIKKSNDIRLIIKSTIHRQQNEGTFSWQMIPPHENFSNWTRLYGIGAFYVGTKHVTLSAVKENSMTVFKRACGHQNLLVRNISEHKNSNTSLLICLKSPYAPPGGGYGKHIGEVMLLHTIKTKHVLIKVYHEWRGKSFKINHKAGWPVTQRTLHEMQQRFESITVHPLSNNKLPLHNATKTKQNRRNLKIS